MNEEKINELKIKAYDTRHDLDILNKKRQELINQYNQIVIEINRLTKKQKE